MRQIVGAAKFRTASAEIADKIRRLVEVLQSGLQVFSTLFSTPIQYPVSAPSQLEAIEQNSEILGNLDGIDRCAHACARKSSSTRASVPLSVCDFLLPHTHTCVVCVCVCACIQERVTIGTLGLFGVLKGCPSVLACVGSRASACAQQT
jgi:hypothetical protein